MYKTTLLQTLKKKIPDFSHILGNFKKLTGIAKVHGDICPWYCATFKEPIPAPVGGVKQGTGPQMFSSLVP